MDETDISKSTVEFEVKTASVDTANNKRDQHLRSPDFFSAKQFPVITFKSTAVGMKEKEKKMCWRLRVILNYSGLRNLSR